MARNAAPEIPPGLPLDVCRHGIAIPLVLPCRRKVGLTGLLDDALENRVLRLATGMRFESTPL
jgi:hypothetical protein